MATKKTFSNEYRNKAIEYVKEHPVYISAIPCQVSRQL